MRYTQDMQWIRKHFLLLFALLVIYAGFLFTHVWQSNRAVLGAKANLVLFEEPLAGKDPILSLVGTAQQSIDITMYLLSDREIIQSLLTACGHGIRVRVLLEQHPFGGGNVNEQTMRLLSGSCVQVQWANPAFPLTHEKTIILDERLVFILDQNLTKSAFVKNREYNVFDSNPQDVFEAEKVFTADWNRTQYQPGTSHLLIGPVNARSGIFSLLTSAQHTIQIESEVIGDPSVVHFLEEKAKTVTIEIIVPSFSQVRANSQIAKQFLQHGIMVKTIKNPYMHAKLLLIDGREAYIGSINLTTQSMDENREVGILIEQPDVIAQLQTSFLSDWDIAQ